MFFSVLSFFSNLCTRLLYLDSHLGRGVVLWVVFFYPLAIAPSTLGLCQRMHRPPPPTQSSVAVKGLHICLFIPCVVAINRTPLLAGVVLVFDYFLLDGEGLQNSCQKSHILSKVLLSMWSKPSPLLRNCERYWGNCLFFLFKKLFSPL